MLVRVLLRLAVVLAVALAGCADAGDEDQALLPENPCTLVRPADVAAAVEGKVTKVERVPSIDQIVAAQDRGGDAADVPVGERRLCSYTTTSGFAAVTVFVPKPSAGGTDLFKSRRRGAKEVDGVGDDAYFAGGASLSVLVDGNMFLVQVQNPAGGGVQPALSKLAKRAIDRLT